MPALHSYNYAIVRVVPRVDREEFVNVGVIVFCRALRFLKARIEVYPERLLALDPYLDLALVEQHLAMIPRICEGGKAAGPIGLLAPAERFHWLVTPRSTIIQPSPPHAGLCADPDAALEHLMATMVRPPAPCRPCPIGDKT
jgi:hypothetical protein